MATTRLALLNQITDEGKRLGSIADMNISDMSANAPVGTTLALLERQLKTMSAVQARVHFSMKQEFQLLRDIIRDLARHGIRKLVVLNGHYENMMFSIEGIDLARRELRYDVVGGNTYVYGNVNGDAIADFCIKLSGIHTLTSSDFVL